MFKSRRIAWALFFVTVVVLGGTAAWAAAEKEKVAVVDEAKLMDAPRVKQYGDQFKAFTEVLDGKLRIRGGHLLLNEDEIKELVDLSTKPNATQPDKDRIKALEALDKTRDADLKRLQQASSPTDQDKAKLKELTDMQQKSKDTGDALQKDYEGQAQEKLKDINAKIESEVAEAVNKVAEAEGYTLVLNKAAVLYGGVDLTEKVVAKLDRKIETK